jgi:hypothetical protein
VALTELRLKYNVHLRTSVLWNVDPYPNLSGKVRIFGNIMLGGGQTRSSLYEYRAVPLHFKGIVSRDEYILEGL